jgi:hypothetical protein
MHDDELIVFYLCVCACVRSSHGTVGHGYEHRRMNRSMGRLGLADDREFMTGSSANASGTRYSALLAVCVAFYLY